ncbi:hypothetical protein BZL30_9323 [Mycobacterium kansasii]|uniref:Uncharacterized protein n=1 Tax=Mycobacterium kansasii TaxID=1768 RepID=A0A1V3WB95_MYCKA|nr:hypothetical protein BZL30_9323 [Mycobacterium kansasii]
MKDLGVDQTKLSGVGLRGLVIRCWGGGGTPRCRWRGVDGMLSPNCRGGWAITSWAV